MGMTWEQYWDEPPRLAVAYRKAYKLRREMENEQAWLQGLYVYDAFAVVLANAFGKHGSSKQYLEQPIDIFPLTESQKKQREREEKEKMIKTLEAMRRQQQQMKKLGD